LLIDADPAVHDSLGGLLKREDRVIQDVYDAQEALDRSTRSGNRWGIAFGAIWLARILVAEGITDP